MLKVLSVDWDYFVDASAMVRSVYFPQMRNQEYATEFIKNTSNIIETNLFNVNFKKIDSSLFRKKSWQDLYKQYAFLYSVGLHPVIYNLINDIQQIPYVFVADSHFWIYPLILQFLKSQKDKKLFVLNIDFHSDCRRDFEIVDCGNWYSKLMFSFKGNYGWLGKDDSNMFYKPKKLVFYRDYKATNITNINWDILFVCRSDFCSLPHLDAEFVRLFKPLIVNKNGYYQTDIWDNRFINMV